MEIALEIPSARQEITINSCQFACGPPSFTRRHQRLRFQSVPHGAQAPQELEVRVSPDGEQAGGAPGLLSALGLLICMVPPAAAGMMSKAPCVSRRGL